MTALNVVSIVVFACVVAACVAARRAMKARVRDAEGFVGVRDGRDIALDAARPADGSADERPEPALADRREEFDLAGAGGDVVVAVGQCNDGS